MVEECRFCEVCRILAGTLQTKLADIRLRDVSVSEVEHCEILESDKNRVHCQYILGLLAKTRNTAQVSRYQLQTHKKPTKYTFPESYHLLLIENDKMPWLKM